MFEKLSRLLRIFLIPVMVLVGLVFFALFQWSFHQDFAASIIILIAIAIGSFELVKETAQSLLAGKFAVDYIALLAITTGLITHNYFVAAVIVLMLSGGNTLEEYGMLLAKQSLTGLADRIPHHVQLQAGNSETAPTIQAAIESVEVGQKILVRKGEVIPLDGVLLSEQAAIDESSLTGEPYPVEKTTDDQIRSGTVNVGNAIFVRVTKKNQDSTYSRIIQMVQAAQNEKAPLIRLADKYSGIFTIVTLCIAGAAFFVSRDLNRILAVLVIATPCPLILATPIALMGGMNAAAKKRIILKRLSSLEVLSRVKAVIFDKTGTLTLGKPILKEIEILDENYPRAKILGIAAAIERNSLHPLAKAVLAVAKKEEIPHFAVTNVHEELGKGIIGTFEGRQYSLSKSDQHLDSAIVLKTGAKKIATFQFIDEVKRDTGNVLKQLQQSGLQLFLFTGDVQERAEALVEKMNLPIVIRANCTPEEKRAGIAELKRQGIVTAMVGDGINDAPALALADVGIVFSNEEHTAASEAADVVLLGGNFTSVLETFRVSQRSIHIALQSIFFGIGLSIVGMLFAAAGFIPPVVGALMQEAIDVAVILNALRASR